MVPVEKVGVYFSISPSRSLSVDNPEQVGFYLKKFRFYFSLRVSVKKVGFDLSLRSLCPLLCPERIFSV